MTTGVLSISAPSNPQLIPRLGTPTIKNLAWPGVPTNTPYCWYELDAGPLLFEAQVDAAMQAQRDAGIKVPWVNASIDRKHNKVRVCIPLEVLTKNTRRTPATAK